MHNNKETNIPHQRYISRRKLFSLAQIWSLAAIAAFKSELRFGGFNINSSESELYPLVYDIAKKSPVSGGHQEYFSPLSAGIGYSTTYESEATAIHSLSQHGQNIRHQMEITQYVNFGRWTSQVPNGSGPEYASLAQSIRELRLEQGKKKVHYHELSD